MTMVMCIIIIIIIIIIVVVVIIISQRACHQGPSVYAQVSLRVPPSGTLARQNLPFIPQRWLQSVPALR